MNKIKLKKIARSNLYSYNLKEDNWEYINYLDTGNITMNHINEIQHINLRVEKLPSRAKRKVRYNNIIYSTVRPSQKHFGIIKNILPNFLVSTGFVVLEIDPLKADADFIYYFLTQDKITSYLHSIAEQSTSAYPSIKYTDVEDIEICLPNLQLQKKVSKFLRLLDKKIELNKKINDNLAA